LEATHSDQRDGNVVDSLRPRLPETTKRTLRGPPEAHGGVHEDVIDTASVPRIERERKEVCVTVSVLQRLPLIVLAAELGTGFLTKLAEERSVEEAHRRERALHQRENLALPIGRQSEQGGVRGRNLPARRRWPRGCR
jgi:hypothetical protein